MNSLGVENKKITFVMYSRVLANLVKIKLDFINVTLLFYKINEAAAEKVKMLTSNDYTMSLSEIFVNNNNNIQHLYSTLSNP